MARSFLVGEEPMIGLSLTTFLYVQLYMEMLAMLGLGAIFLRMWSLFFLAISSLTNSFDLSMILLIFSICFFFIYSFPWFATFLFSLSSFTARLRVLEREFVFAFFTGESFRERVRGFSEFIFGKIFIFSVERTAAFFLSNSFRIDSQREFSSKSPKNFSSLLRQLSSCGNLSLFLLSRMQTAKIKPRLYLSMRFSTMLVSSFSRKSLLFFLRVAAWSRIWPRAIQSSYFLISALLLLKQYIFSLGSTSQSLTLISSSSVMMMPAGERAPWMRPFWWRAARHSMTGQKVLQISASSKWRTLQPRLLFSISVSSVDFSLAQRRPLLQRMGLRRAGCEMLHSALAWARPSKYWQAFLVGLCSSRISFGSNFIITNYLPDALMPSDRIYFVYYMFYQFLFDLNTPNKKLYPGHKIIIAGTPPQITGSNLGLSCRELTKRSEGEGKACMK